MKSHIFVQSVALIAEIVATNLNAPVGDISWLRPSEGYV